LSIFGNDDSVGRQQEFSFTQQVEMLSVLLQ